jgi:hypothetical protein
VFNVFETIDIFHIFMSAVAFLDPVNLKAYRFILIILYLLRYQRRKRTKPKDTTYGCIFLFSGSFRYRNTANALTRVVGRESIYQFGNRFSVTILKRDIS